MPHVELFTYVKEMSVRPFSARFGLFRGNHASIPGIDACVGNEERIAPDLLNLLIVRSSAYPISVMRANNRLSISSFNIKDRWRGMIQSINASVRFGFAFPELR